MNLAERGAFVAIPVVEITIAIAAVILFKKGKWKQLQQFLITSKPSNEQNPEPKKKP